MGEWDNISLSHDLELILHISSISLGLCCRVPIATEEYSSAAKRGATKLWFSLVYCVYPKTVSCTLLQYWHIMLSFTPVSQLFFLLQRYTATLCQTIFPENWLPFSLIWVIIKNTHTALTQRCNLLAQTPEGTAMSLTEKARVPGFLFPQHSHTHFCQREREKRRGVGLQCSLVT